MPSRLLFWGFVPRFGPSDLLAQKKPTHIPPCKKRSRKTTCYPVNFQEILLSSMCPWPFLCWNFTRQFLTLVAAINLQRTLLTTILCIWGIDPDYQKLCSYLQLYSCFSSLDEILTPAPQPGNACSLKIKGKLSLTHTEVITFSSLSGALEIKKSSPHTQGCSWKKPVENLAQYL